MPIQPSNAINSDTIERHTHNLNVSLKHISPDQRRRVIEAINDIFPSPNDLPRMTQSPWDQCKRFFMTPCGYHRLDESESLLVEGIELSEIITQRDEQQAGTSTSSATDTPDQASPPPKKQLSVAKQIGLIAVSTICVAGLLVAATYPLVTRAMTIEAEQGGNYTG